MALPDASDHAIAAFRRFYALLPRSNDAALFILKIHLLIEEQVRAFLAERVLDSTAMRKADLDCHQAICMAEALCADDIHPRVWEAARKLNELRNKVAHDLEPAGVLERMKNICDLIGLAPQLRTGFSPPDTPKALSDFGFACSMLYHEIALFVKRKPAEVLELVNRDQAP